MTRFVLTLEDGSEFNLRRIDRVVSYLNNNKVNELYVFEGINYDDLKLLCEAIKKNTILEQLEISGIIISTDLAKLIADAITDNHIGVININLIENTIAAYSTLLLLKRFQGTDVLNLPMFKYSDQDLILPSEISFIHDSDPERRVYERTISTINRNVSDAIGPFAKLLSAKFWKSISENPSISDQDKQQIADSYKKYAEFIEMEVGEIMFQSLPAEGRKALYDKVHHQYQNYKNFRIMVILNGSLYLLVKRIKKLLPKLCSQQ